MASIATHHSPNMASRGAADIARIIRAKHGTHVGLGPPKYGAWALPKMAGALGDRLAACRRFDCTRRLVYGLRAQRAPILIWLSDLIWASGT
eukprot:1123406-Prymnesium_polylepis.1